jgi:hypothetical protein
MFARITVSDPDPYLLGYRLVEQERLERQADDPARRHS